MKKLTLPAQSETMQSPQLKMRDSVVVRRRVLLLTLAFIVVGSFYTYQFFIEGGREFLTPDGWHYLAMARGEAVVQPFNTRLVVPLIAFLISTATGLKLQSVFQGLTVVCFFISLILLVAALQKRGANQLYQVTVVISFSSLAAVFGHVPVQVDAPLLLLVCLTIAALDSQRLAVALAMICFATLTKEYGIFLVLPWAIQAYQQKGMRTLAGLFLPASLLICAKLMLPALPRDLNEMVTYQLRALQGVGVVIYSKYVYAWLWGALWPIFLLAIVSLIRGWHKKGRLILAALTSDQAWFVVILIPVPFLLLGDWDRASIILIPFACIAAIPFSLARDSRYCLLVILGGIATALARRFSAETILPNALIVALITISVLASALILIMIIRHFRTSEIQKYLAA